MEEEGCLLQGDEKGDGCMSVYGDGSILTVLFVRVGGWMDGWMGS